MSRKQRVSLKTMRRFLGLADDLDAMVINPDALEVEVVFGTWAATRPGTRMNLQE
jgi:hypothetical protein